MRADHGRCRCYELGDECASCRAAIARAEDRGTDPMLAGDYERLEAGPWWNEVPA